MDVSSYLQVEKRAEGTIARADDIFIPAYGQGGEERMVERRCMASPGEVTRQPIFAQEKQARIQFQRREEYAKRVLSKRECIINCSN